MHVVPFAVDLCVTRSLARRRLAHRLPDRVYVRCAPYFTTFFPSAIAFSAGVRLTPLRASRGNVGATTTRPRYGDRLRSNCNSAHSFSEIWTARVACGLSRYRVERL
jgi:hypothetical protein